MKERKTLTQRKKLIYIFTIPKLKRELHTHPTTHTHTPQTTQKRKTTDRNQVPDPKIFGWPLKFYSNISLKYFRHMSQTIPLLRPYWAHTHPSNKTQPHIKLPPPRLHLIGASSTSCHATTSSTSTRRLVITFLTRCPLRASMLELF